MDQKKFNQTVYYLVEEYFNNFSKKPHYLLVNSKFELADFVEKDDLKNYDNERFKGMMIVRTPDIAPDKLQVY